MRVGIYTRVSGKSNRQDAANQSIQLVEYCQSQGWEYEEYTDRMSGTKADRAAFQRMFEDARLKRFDLVLFWALDRFSREGTLKTLEYLQRLDSYGVAWKSYTEQYLDSTGMFRDVVLPSWLRSQSKSTRGYRSAWWLAYAGRSGMGRCWGGSASLLIGRECADSMPPAHPLGRLPQSLACPNRSLRISLPARPRLSPRTRWSRFRPPFFPHSYVVSDFHRYAIANALLQKCKNAGIPDQRASG